MLARLRTRLTYANVMATIAIFIALGGSGYAALTINGKDIKNRTIGAKKVKKGTLTGTEIKESKLGKVPSAANADRLGGQVSRDFVQRKALVRVGVRRLKNGQTTQLVTGGPLTITARCTINSGGNDTARIFAKTTEANSFLAGKDLAPALGPATPEASARVAEASGATGGQWVDARVFLLNSPTGGAVHGELTATTNLLGGTQECEYLGYAIVSVPVFL